jgi:hypothetical protein
MLDARLDGRRRVGLLHPDDERASPLAERTASRATTPDVPAGDARIGGVASGKYRKNKLSWFYWLR